MDGTEKKNNGEHDVFPAHFGACVDGSGAVTTYKKSFVFDAHKISRNTQINLTDPLQPESSTERKYFNKTYPAAAW